MYYSGHGTSYHANVKAEEVLQTNSLGKGDNYKISQLQQLRPKETPFNFFDSPILSTYVSSRTLKQTQIRSSGGIRGWAYRLRANTIKYECTFKEKEVKVGKSIPVFNNGKFYLYATGWSTRIQGRKPHLQLLFCHHKLLSYFIPSDLSFFLHSGNDGLTQYRKNM